MTHQIIGACRVGKDTIIGDNVILGHPGKESLSKNRDFSISAGAVIGNNCIIRSGSVVYENSQLGDSIQIAHFVVIRENVKIGDGCAFGNNVVVREGALLGSNVRLMESVVISEGAQLGNNIFIGPNVSLTAGRYMTGALEASGELSRQAACDLEAKYWQEPSVIIEDEVRIGANAVLLAGVRLGRGCVIASGAVVTTNIPAGATAAGNPARLLKLATK